MRIVFLKTTAVIITLTIMTACSFIFPAEEKTTPPPLIEPETYNYLTEEVVMETIANRVQKSGRFTTLIQYNLSFEKRGGYLKELNIGLRQRVKAGEILASFDTEDLEKQVAEQILSVEAAQIDYDNALRQMAAAQDNYKRVSDIASMDKKNAKNEIEEKRRLFEEDEITEEELKAAETEYKHIIAEIEGRVAQARSATETQVDAKALISLRQAEMKLANLREEFGNTVIRSPINGVITYVEELNVGSFVEAKKTVVTVADDSELLLLVTDTSSSSTFLEDFPSGASVDVRIMGRHYDGMIVYTPDDVPVNNILTNHLYILIEVYDLPLDDVSIGTTAVAVIDTEVRENVMTVSANAVKRYGDYTYVQVLENGISREQPVELGLVTTTRIEIISGLKIGDVVIIR